MKSNYSEHYGSQLVKLGTRLEEGDYGKDDNEDLNLKLVVLYYKAIGKIERDIGRIGRITRTIGQALVDGTDRRENVSQLTRRFGGSEDDVETVRTLAFLLLGDVGTLEMLVDKANWYAVNHPGECEGWYTPASLEGTMTITEVLARYALLLAGKVEPGCADEEFIMALVLPFFLSLGLEPGDVALAGTIMTSLWQLPPSAGRDEMLDVVKHHGRGEDMLNAIMVLVQLGQENRDAGQFFIERAVQYFFLFPRSKAMAQVREILRAEGGWSLVETLLASVARRLLDAFIIVEGHPDVIRKLDEKVFKGDASCFGVLYKERTWWTCIVQKVPRLKNVLRLGNEFDRLFKLVARRGKDGGYSVKPAYHRGDPREGIIHFMKGFEETLRRELYFSW